MSSVIVKSEVRRIAHVRGRRVSSGYLRWLDRKIREAVETHCHQLRGTVTLMAFDAEAASEYNRRRKRT